MWYEHWFDNATSKVIEGLEAMGIVKAEGSQLHLQVKELVKPNWLHVAGSTDCRNCALWAKLFFKHLNIIHSFCRYHCWKVVTKPRNVKELIQIHNLMYVIPYVYNFINPLPGKAGLDTRHYTNWPYAAFNYCTSLAEALRVREMVIYVITEYMPNDEIDGKHLQDTVVVKRSCTEMVAKVPTTDSWWDAQQSPQEWEVEKRLEEIFVCDPDMTFQPAWLKDKVLQNWLNYANSIGDKSLVDYVGADIFSVNQRTYGVKDLGQKGGDKEPKEKVTEKKKRAKTKEKK
jgi:hypothetical protein